LQKLKTLVYCLLIGAGLVLFVACDNESVNQENEINIGALLSLTGNWSSLGITSQVILEYGIGEINDYFRDSGDATRLRLIVEDTQLDPEIAYTRLRYLVENKKCRIVLGPQSSAEIARIKEYADANSVMLVSQGSTAGSLSIADDNIFRFCPNDIPEGQAISDLMWANGIRTVIPVWRADVGNIGLHEAMLNSFTTLGGVVMEGIEYSVDAVDFAPVSDSIHTLVNVRLIDDQPAEIGIYLAGFDEIVHLFNVAKNDSLIAALKWYGSNGTALSAVLCADTGAVRFASRVGFPTPIFGLNPDDHEEWEPIVNGIENQTGIKPDAYTLAIYDALWVAALTYQEADEEDFAQIKSTYTDIAQYYIGLTGLTTLNSAGDRAIANFDFWAICNGVWQLVGYFQPNSTIIWNGCP